MPSFPPRIAAAALAAALLAAAPAAQVKPVYSRGVAGLVLALERLRTTASAMHTAAHPDDEDTALIARLARGDHARVAYLSLNRGEGGQNIIGTELFDALGVIRTEELLQARTLDGGEQFFTRAYDFGFTKTPEEAAAKWDEAVILGDMVRAIRAYRPLVILNGWSGTSADGHGQHQLAGRLAPLALAAAADPARYPEQIAEGLRPWQARKLYVRQAFSPDAAAPTLRLPTGTVDPVLGRSFFEIAMEGRSQHKSQEMGVLEVRGPKASNLILGNQPGRRSWRCRACRGDTGSERLRRHRHIARGAAEAGGPAGGGAGRRADGHGRRRPRGGRQPGRGARAGEARARPGPRPGGGARRAGGGARPEGAGRCEGRRHVPAGAQGRRVRGRAGAGRRRRRRCARRSRGRRPRRDDPRHREPVRARRRARRRRADRAGVAGRVDGHPGVRGGAARRRQPVRAVLPRGADARRSLGRARAGRRAVLRAGTGSAHHGPARYTPGPA